MSSYNKQSTISTFFVNKSLIESLENYFNKEIIEIINLHSTEEQKIHKSFEILLHDSHGQESYTSIKDYKLPLFRNDVKGITVEFKVFAPNKDVKISLRFGSKEENSDISITLSDENAREKVSAIEHGILSIIDHNKTLNWLLFPNQYIGSIAFLVFAYFGLLAISGDSSKKEAFIYGSLFWSGVIYFWIFQYFKGYCSFDTNKQKQLDKWFNWLIMGLAGFLLFTSLLTSFRRSIFGF